MRLALSGGLFNSLDRTQVPEGRLFDMHNASVDAGIEEAGPGFEDWWHQAVGFNPNSDICWGAGFARYGSSEEFYVMIQGPSLAYPARATLFVVNAISKAVTTFPFPLWADRDPSYWSFQRAGEYMYAINEVDGMFRRKIGVGDSWERYPMAFDYATSAQGAAVFERPNGQYPTEAWAATGAGVPLAAATETYPLTTYPYPATSTIDTATGLITLEQTGNGGSESRIQAWFILKFDAAVDLSEKRYLAMEARTHSIYNPTTGNPWDDRRLNEEPRLDVVTGIMEVWFHTSPTATNGNWSANGWKKGRIRAVLKDRMPATGAEATWYVSAILWVDVDETQYGNSTPTFLTSIRKMALAVPISTGNDYQVTLSSPMIGGVMLNKPAIDTYMSHDLRTRSDTLDPVSTYYPSLRDVNYAITDYHHVSAAESPATFLRVQSTSGLGIPPVNGVPPLGARVSISLGSIASGYTRKRVYRQRNSDGGQWYLIHETATGGGVITDSRVDALGDAIPWNQISIHPAGKDFQAKNSSFSGKFLCEWKNHMAVINGREVYLSYYENPGRFVLPYRDSPTGAAITDDPAIGSTGWLSDDTSDFGQLLIAQDCLYGVGQDGVFVSIGDSALNSTPFRKMPGTYGALSNRAGAAFAGGILVGSTSGLYFYRAYRASMTSDTDYEHFEVTKDVRRSWSTLLALGGSYPLIVRVWRNEVWCVKGSYYLRRTRNLNWEFGQFAETPLKNGASSGAFYGVSTEFEASAIGEAGSPEDLLSKLGVTRSVSTVGVFDLLPDDKLGLFMVASNGYMHRIDPAIRSHAGVAIHWATIRGTMVSGSERIKATGSTGRIRSAVALSTTSPVRIGFETYDGQDGVKYSTYNFDSTTARIPYSNAGPAMELTIGIGARSAAHQVTAMDVDFAGLKPGAER